MNSDEIQKEADKFIESERDKCDDCGIRFCYIHWPMYRDFMLKKARAEGWQKGFHEGCETVIENSDVIKKAERQRCIDKLKEEVVSWTELAEAEREKPTGIMHDHLEWYVGRIHYTEGLIAKLSSKSGEEE